MTENFTSEQMQKIQQELQEFDYAVWIFWFFFW
ncbi:hypothetical protein GvMRE_IIg91 [endosymbiont GvMRE of Glomus versiforme]|nr:hypothetical protein GvMRE_IIg91 [endosymbiont GvMRE of Glomus versiforme]